MSPRNHSSRARGNQAAATQAKAELSRGSRDLHAVDHDGEPTAREPYGPATPSGFLALKGWQQWPLSVIGLFQPRADTVFRSVVRRGRAVSASGERASFEDNIFPTIAQIAFDCMMPERTVRRTLAGLKNWGMLTWQSGSRRRSNHYRVTTTEAEVLDIAIGTAVDHLRRPPSSWKGICRLTKALLRLAHQASQCGEFMEKHHAAPADVPATRPPVATHVATDGHPDGRGWPPTWPPVADQEDPSVDTSEIQKKQKPAASSADVVMDDPAGDGNGETDGSDGRTAERLLGMLNEHFAVGSNSKTRLLATRYAAVGISADLLLQELRSQVTPTLHGPPKPGVVVSILDDPHFFKRCIEREERRQEELRAAASQAMAEEAACMSRIREALSELETTIESQRAAAEEAIPHILSAGAMDEWHVLVSVIVQSGEHRKYWQAQNEGPEFEAMFAGVELSAATGLAAILLWNGHPIHSADVTHAVKQIRRKIRSSSANRPEVTSTDDAPAVDSPSSTAVNVAQPTLAGTTT